MFGRLEDLINNTLSLEVNRVMQDIFKSDDLLTAIIVDLNTEDQLFRGTDATGKTLSSIGGAYSFRTVEEKRRKGQPFDRVTLKDTGDFYKSFNVDIQPKFIQIVADFFKENQDLRERWGDNLAGLDDKSREELREELIPRLTEYVTRQMLHA